MCSPKIHLALEMDVCPHPVFCLFFFFFFFFNRFMALRSKWRGGLMLQHQVGGWMVFEDDTIHEDEDVKEAIRRLPENLYKDSMFHIKRALDLTMRHQILPKEQWTKYEEDKFYLEPYLKEVNWERKERRMDEGVVIYLKSVDTAVLIFFFPKLIKPEIQLKNYLVCRCTTLYKCLL
uniref:Cytochrome b-c1 complex subunit 7 n=1 Tax=Oryctolagus cuniculus TaxID=9986 RepID=A0A5F9D4Z5_RABIT